MSRFRFVFGLALLGLATLAAPPATAQPIPYGYGTRIGVKDLSVDGNTAVDYTSDDFKSTASGANTAAALSDGLVIVECFVRNSHATQSLTFSYASYSGAGPVTTDRITVPAGASISVPAYGLNATHISFDASGASTTGQAVCQFVVH